MGTAETAEADRANRSLTEIRLGWLIDENHRIARERSLYRNDRERLLAEAMRRPVTISKAYRWFGLMLGSVPPAAMVAKAAANSGQFEVEAFGFALLILLAGLAAGIVGYFSGKLTANTVKRAERFSMPNRAVLIAFVGMTWGIACGAAGGVLIFIFGAIPAAFIGGITAALALPIFATLLSTVRAGNHVALSHFLPISLGIVLSIVAFIFGL
ncbi:MAG TPA: hypothetical protein VJL58_12145 [Pyrinomonadaceae bacterium]|nr:hypothetical protein [Pyrinomonadaceae bacterium]